MLYVISNEAMLGELCVPNRSSLHFSLSQSKLCSRSFIHFKNRKMGRLITIIFTESQKNFCSSLCDGDIVPMRLGEKAFPKYLFLFSLFSLAWTTISRYALFFLSLFLCAYRRRKGGA